MSAWTYTADATEFGFHIPTGDPEQIGGCAANWAFLSQTLDKQRSVLAKQVRETASGHDWSGAAAGRFAASARVLMATIAGNAEASEKIAQTFTQLSADLAAAQRTTRQALTDCEDAQIDSRAQNEIATAESTKAIAEGNLAIESAHDPQLAARHFEAADDAERAAGRALNAAKDAEDRLHTAKLRGQSALEDYHSAVRALVQTLESAEADLKSAAEQARGVASTIGTYLPPILAKSKERKQPKHHPRPLNATQAALAATYFSSTDQALRDIGVSPKTAKAAAAKFADQAARHEQDAEQLDTVILPGLRAAQHNPAEKKTIVAVLQAAFGDSEGGL